MKKNDEGIQKLIAELRLLYGKVRGEREFLALKKSELRPGDEISFFGFIQAREQLACETSLLTGHAILVQEIIARKKIVVPAADQRFLKEINALSWMYISRI
ncbi:MAG: hypothetical protein WCI20_00325 [bacterium]